ncbi:MFS transporter [Halorussus caseinilyticus]|uniref:MFS transporter n=1 Tax=Halorussus caseinilyticus TaxID=3034025 RepID=A0ABD5WMU4_9EURY|nr:MFS transporter [Halorussus sp. DT72]
MTQNLRTRLARLFEPFTAQYASLRHLRDRDLALLSVARLLDQMSISFIVPLLPIYAENLGASAFLIGLIFSAETLSKAVFSTPFGHLSDRFDRRLLVSVGLVISALSVVAFGFVEVPLLFIGFRALDGAASAMREPAANAYIGDAFDESERGGAMGAYRTVGMLGVAIGPAVGGLLSASYGYALPFVVLGAGTLVGGLAVFVSLNPSSDQSAESSGDDSADAETDWSLLPDLSLGTIREATTLPMAALGVSVFVAQVGSGAFSPLFAVLLETTLGAGPAYTGTMYSVFGLSMFLFMPVGGTLADTAGRKRSLLIGKVLWAVVVFGLALATTRLVPPVLLFVAGIASAFAGPALGAMQYELAPEGREGTVLGAYSTLASAGMAVGPLLGGALTDVFGVTTVFLLMGGLWLFDTGTIAFGVRETVSKGSESSEPSDSTAGSSE